MALFTYLKSTILSKVVMAVTGIILLLFLIVHVLGNLQIFIGRDSFNAYSHFLHSTGELIWIFRVFMIIVLVLHLITSIRLKLLNMQAKPKKYAVKNYVAAKLTSRTMLWTGSGIGLFVLFHLLHLTVGTIDSRNFNNPDYYERGASLYAKFMEGEIQYEGGDYMAIHNSKILFERNDVYKAVVMGFRNPYLSLIYIVALLILGFHLNHAIQSSFQTLGWNHPKYFPRIRRWSAAFVTIMILAYLIVPFAVMLRFVGGAL